MPSQLAAQALLYVLPLEPHTGAYSMVQTQELGFGFLLQFFLAQEKKLNPSNETKKAITKTLIIIFFMTKGGLMRSNLVKFKT